MVCFILMIFKYILSLLHAKEYIYIQRERERERERDREREREREIKV